MELICVPCGTLKYKKLHEGAKAPVRATIGSAGLDLYAVSREEIMPGVFKYDTGIAVEIPAGYVGILYPRSSIYKTGLILSNSSGVIDADYRGSIGAIFYGSKDSKPYEVGDRIVQLVLVPIPVIKLEEVSELGFTERGAGGFGSTGTH